jgi:uncharacterized membrane protein YfcA
VKNVSSPDAALRKVLARYALGLAPHQAVCVSMVAVNVLALVSSVDRLKAHEVAVGDGLRLAIPGLLGAPLGAWIGTFLTGHALMIVFGVFVGILAVQMLVTGERRRRRELIRNALTFAPSC